MKKNYLFLLLAIMLGTAVSSSAFAVSCTGTGGTWHSKQLLCTCPADKHNVLGEGCVKN